MALNKNLGPHDGAVDSPTCAFCDQRATYLAPQSTDRGETAEWVTVCVDHANGWNEGGDWEAPIYELVPAPDIGGHN